MFQKFTALNETRKCTSSCLCYAFYPLLCGFIREGLGIVSDNLCGILSGCAVQFRIKSVEGEYFRAETAACMTDKGVVCSTRVDRDI